MGSTFIFVSCDDWQGIYVNGELRVEGHSISVSEWLDFIKESKFYHKVESYWVNEEWMGDRGSFPEYFDEIPKEMLE